MASATLGSRQGVSCESGGSVRSRSMRSASPCSAGIVMCWRAGSASSTTWMEVIVFAKMTSR